MMLFKRIFGGGAGSIEDSSLIRRTADRAHGAWTTLSRRDNPGVNAFPDFLSAQGDERKTLELELRDVIARYGASHVSAKDSSFIEKQMSHMNVRIPVNMRRATGRFEREDQEVCPWRHGDDFEIDALPPGIRKLGDKISTSFPSLGPLRDVTVNARTHSFFRLDPHLDPPDDGSNIFILGLISDTVLTLSMVGPPLSTIADQRFVSVESWQPGKDIDILAREGTLVHLSGDARTTWNHGIRLGLASNQILAQQNNDVQDKDLLCDWFGSTTDLVPRASERISVVYAF